MTVKLVATDLDGTMLQDNKVDPKTKAIVQKMIKKGVELVISTGRMHCATQMTVRQLGINPYIVSYNGAMVHQGLYGKELQNITMDKDIAKKLIAIGMENGVVMHVYINDVLYVQEMTNWTANYMKLCAAPTRLLEDLKEAIDIFGDPTKVLFISTPQNCANMQKMLRQKFAGEIYITSSAPYFVEAINPNVHKGKGVKIVADRLGIKQSEILVIGDNYNDMDLFEAGDIKIAMGDAVDALKESATWVTDTVTNDGWYKAIRKFVFEE